VIYQLMKRDLAWRAAPWMTGALGVVWPLCLLLWKLPEASASALYGAVFSVILVLAINLASIQDLWSHFLSALPVTARQIYLARVLAMVALLWTPLVAGAAIQIFLAAPLLSSSPVVIVCYATLLTLALQSVLMTGLKVPRGVILGVFCASVALVLPLAVLPVVERASTFRLSVYAAPFGAVCLVSTVAIFWRTWVLISGKPLASSRNGDASATAGDTRARPHGLFLIRLRYFYSWVDVLFVPILFLQVLTGQWLTGVFFISALWMAPTRRWMDPLPVSRRNLLVWRILPVLVGLTAGYVVGIMLHTGRPGRWNDISETTTQGWPPSAGQQSCGRKNVTPPLEHWRHSKGGAAETVRSPWGETFTPPVVNIMATKVYNPYAVGCTNSQRFFDWQFVRATAAVYGSSVTLDDFVHDRHPPARTGTTIQVLTLGAILTIAMLVFVFVALKDWYRLNRLPKWWWSGFYGVLLLGWFGLTFPAGNSTIEGGFQWLSWHLPDNLPAVIGIWASLTLVLGLLLDKLTREAELAPAPAQTVNFLSRFQQ
jgi:hypothetical protein